MISCKYMWWVLFVIKSSVSFNFSNSVGYTIIILNETHHYFQDSNNQEDLNGSFRIFLVSFLANWVVFYQC